MVNSETRRDAEILVRNPSPRLRDLSKTLPRFRDPAKMFRDPRFSWYHSPPLPKAKGTYDLYLRSNSVIQILWLLYKTTSAENICHFRITLFQTKLEILLPTWTTSSQMSKAKLHDIHMCSFSNSLFFSDRLSDLKTKIYNKRSQCLVFCGSCRGVSWQLGRLQKVLFAQLLKKCPR